MSRLRPLRLSRREARLMRLARACSFDGFAHATEREVEKGRFDLCTGPGAAKAITEVLRLSADNEREAPPSRLRGAPR